LCKFSIPSVLNDAFEVKWHTLIHFTRFMDWGIIATSPQTRRWRHVESKVYTTTELIEMLQKRNGKGPRISSFADFDNQRSRDQKPNSAEGFIISPFGSKTKCLELERIVSTKR
jgi:hypothetical protein